ncbi:hypothetical protein E2562_025857 [Oryza meyeriana var. granulata]|uniref:DUF834 domain-containing protein n=1 Tax=Oryza meyeriana var. granulata TaxID=110450 RepID=A0A6G1BZY6_9ORYZ|nr:hypothetical protein E2562_025857 [Oryza meyeriana var. granulata]
MGEIGKGGDRRRQWSQGEIEEGGGQTLATAPKLSGLLQVNSDRMAADVDEAHNGRHRPSRGRAGRMAASHSPCRREDRRRAT